MNWEKMTSPEFEAARDEAERLCLLPIGVIEKHGAHLPLGQDILYIHEIVTRAAEKEPAMVFPPYFFGQILEARHVPGTIALGTDLVMTLLEAVCDEIGRNGFEKIMIVNGHGGNNAMLEFFQFRMLETGKPYLLYTSPVGFASPKSDAVCEATLNSHAGETETCRMMTLRPELVKLDAWIDNGEDQDRIAAVRKTGLRSPLDWYSRFPNHIAADEVPFTAEKGEVFVAEHIDVLIRQIRAVKNDATSKKLYSRFIESARKP